MAKISIEQKSLALALILGLGFQFVPYYNLPLIGLIIIGVVAIILLLK